MVAVQPAGEMELPNLNDEARTEIIKAHSQKRNDMPPYDKGAKEAELTWGFGVWRDPTSKLGSEFLYEDVAPRAGVSGRLRR